VDCSTVAADTARAIDEGLRASGASFLDAPVSGGVEGARNGTLAMMVGGEAAVLERARPALAAMASRIVHMGPVGSGQATKAVNQIMGAGINQAVTEALAFGAAQGLDLARVIEVVSQGASANWFLAHRGPSMVEGRFPAGFKVALHLKDLRICKTMAEDKGVALSVIDQTLGDYQRLIDGGHGDEDISALYRIKSALFGTDA
jgi:3-hydroxyisobutyrate dehydrogenase